MTVSKSDYDQKHLKTVPLVVGEELVMEVTMNRDRDESEGTSGVELRFFHEGMIYMEVEDLKKFLNVVAETISV